jgi:hypothetical protein
MISRTSKTAADTQLTNEIWHKEVHVFVCRLPGNINIVSTLPNGSKALTNVAISWA